MITEIIRTTTYVKWKEINLFPGYYISNTGIFRIGKTISKPFLKKGTYYKYVIMVNTTANIRHRKDIHVIMWEHFGDRAKPKGYEIHHDDLNIHNNHIDNLRLIAKEDHNRLHHIKRKPNELKSILSLSSYEIK